jgi:hypothetical protein
VGHSYLPLTLDPLDEGHDPRRMKQALGDFSLFCGTGILFLVRARLYRLENSCFVSGHGFSRAMQLCLMRAFSPWAFSEGYGLEAVRKSFAAKTVDVMRIAHRREVYE